MKIKTNKYLKKDLNLNSEVDLLHITSKNDDFVDVQTEYENNYLVCNFDITRLKCAENIEKESKKDILRFLINVASLERYNDKYIFSLDPSNLYYDFNMKPKILFRDVANDKTNDFINKYKALILTLLNNKYNYEQYYNGGLSLCNNDKKLNKYVNAEDISSIVSLLKKEYLDTIHKEKKHYTLCPKFLLIILLITTFVSSLFFVKEKITLNNVESEYEHNKTIMTASLNFNKEQYSKVIKNLSKISTNKLDNDMMYILAVSYIKSSSLDDAQKENALLKLRSDANDKYNIYWVRLGRHEFKKAYNIASQFDDERLLYYGYSVELSSLPGNIKLTAEEKRNRKEELTRLLDEYIKKMEGKQ